jgi:hypothetical protein
MMILKRKPELETFIPTCTPLAIIPTLEYEMQARVENIAKALLGFEQTANPIDNLAKFLRADSDFLGIILSLTKLSQEKFLRILSADRFAKGDFEREWNSDTIYRKLQNEDGFAERIASLFLDGRNSPILIQQVAAFYLNQLSLPTNWAEIIQDEPTEGMKKEAVSAGFYTSEMWQKTYPKLQILSIADLFNNKKLLMPPSHGTFKDSGRITPEQPEQRGLWQGET